MDEGTKVEGISAQAEDERGLAACESPCEKSAESAPGLNEPLGDDGDFAELHDGGDSAPRAGRFDIDGLSRLAQKIEGAARGMQTADIVRMSKMADAAVLAAMPHLAKGQAAGAMATQMAKASSERIARVAAEAVVRVSASALAKAAEKAEFLDLAAEDDAAALDGITTDDSADDGALDVTDEAASC